MCPLGFQFLKSGYCLKSLIYTIPRQVQPIQIQDTQYTIASFYKNEYQYAKSVHTFQVLKMPL